MKVRIDMLVDVPDDFDFGSVEQFIEDAIFYMADDECLEFEVDEILRVQEV